MGWILVPPSSGECFYVPAPLLRFVTEIPILDWHLQTNTVIGVIGLAVIKLRFINESVAFAGYNHPQSHVENACI